MARSSEQYFQKLKRHLPLVKDPTVIILRGHLLIEELLDELIAASLKDSTAIKDARLTFFQKLCIAKGILGQREGNLWKPIDELNRLRNTVSHNLPDTALSARLDPSLRAFYEEEFHEIPTDIHSKSKALRKGIIFHCAMLHGFIEGLREASGTVKR